ncbi:MAG: membrane protein insertase YidC [Candidatus Omnitrophica bacterium]|nr:membrane protein insertase YidC [Candidatus Omnitrophota bacterium]MDD5771103.1 membrane protein insertase YidC [Candidatus Omnitrophota bacterium]
MEKRLILAIALSALILLGWSALFPKPQPIDNKEVEKEDAFIKYPGKQTNDKINIPPETQNNLNPAETLKFPQGERDIIFDPSRGSIVDVIFNRNLEHRFPLKTGLLTESNDLFKQESKKDGQISFVSQDQDKRIIKRFICRNDSYIIELEVQTKNISGRPILFDPHLALGRMDLSAKNPQSRYQDILLSNSEKTMHVSAGKELSLDNIKFIGFRDQYFCAILEPVNLVTKAYIKKIAPQETEVGIVGKEIILNPGEQIGHLYRIYLGPQDLSIINNINPEWSSIIYFGTFDFIAQLILQLLGFFYSIVHNWGWAIIILSLSVYLLLFPLSLKQMRSMKEMQLLQPKIDALRKELKDNPQRLNKEIMELYKEHKVNPLGGCLPLLLQMPIFFALYQALIRSAALRGAHFLWIKDLSAPDKLFTLKNSIPFLGNQINILPILMAIGMFVQQKISSVKATGEAAQQQKMMSIIMPVMFGVIFYQMPSGLVLYWLVNSMLMLFYQLRLNKQK